VTVRKLLLSCVLVLGLGVGHAHAAILQVDAAGFLTGATGVMVAGTAYDVRFQAGSCNSVFDGCDPTVDLLFTSGASALSASQALLDQVFLGDDSGIYDPFTPGFFDSHPGLTQGCTAGGFNVCIAQTPYGFSQGISLLLGVATNYGPVTGRADEASLTSIIGGGTATSGIETFAVWSLSAGPTVPEPPPVTPVPEPSTVVLLGAGLIAFVLPVRRRARRMARAE
jgi:hypothetical protein